MESYCNEVGIPPHLSVVIYWDRAPKFFRRVPGRSAKDCVQRYKVRYGQPFLACAPFGVTVVLLAILCRNCNVAYRRISMRNMLYSAVCHVLR
jgi:hypothetical protein